MRKMCTYGQFCPYNNRDQSSDQFHSKHDGSDVTQPDLLQFWTLAAVPSFLHLFSQIIFDPQKTDYHVTNTILQLQLSGFE